jgi:hypothetical protein
MRQKGLQLEDLCEACSLPQGESRLLIVHQFCHVGM